MEKECGSLEFVARKTLKCYKQSLLDQPAGSLENQHSKKVLRETDSGGPTQGSGLEATYIALQQRIWAYSSIS